MSNRRIADLTPADPRRHAFVTGLTQDYKFSLWHRELTRMPSSDAPEEQSLTKQESPIGVCANNPLGLAVICVAILLSALAPPSAKAAFVIENYSVLGASSVILDTTTGLYWVKPTDTLGLTYPTVQSDIANGLTGNFSYASYSQVSTLLADAGITDFTNVATAGSYAGASAMVAAFGQTSGGTLTNGAYHGSYAQVDGVYAGNYDAFTIAYQFNAAGAFGSCTSVNCAQASVGAYSGNAVGPYGSWLVASSLNSGPPPPVPLPASAWLMLSGIAGLGLLSRRRGARVMKGR